MSRWLFELMERPAARWLLLCALFLAALSGFDIADFAGGAGAAGDAAVAGGDGPLDWLLRALLAVVCTAGLMALSRLAMSTQVIVTWALLLALFLLFFYSFQLSYEYIWGRLPHLLGLGLKNGFLMGAALSVFICVVAIIASTLLALIAALARLSHSGIAVGTATFYISFFRGTPLLLQILLVYLGLPQLGVVIDPIPAAVIALSLCYGAYMAEIFRAGIQSIAHGQREAALALGLRPTLVMRLVILPQAIRIIVPPTGNQFIAMLKDSSLVSVLGAWELMYMARTHGRAEFKYMEMLISAAIIYWMLSMSLEYLQSKVEKHFAKSDARSH